MPGDCGAGFGGATRIWESGLRWLVEWGEERKMARLLEMLLVFALLTTTHLSQCFGNGNEDSPAVARRSRCTARPTSAAPARP